MQPVKKKSETTGKISAKLQKSFTITIACFAVALITAILSSLIIGNKLTDFYNNSYAVSVNAVDMRRSFQSAVKNFLRAASTADPTETENYISEAEKDMGSLKDGIALLQKRFSGDPALVDNFYKYMEESVPHKELLIEYLLAQDNVNAIKVFNESYAPILVKAQDYLIQIGDVAGQNATDNFNSANKTKTFTIILTIILAISSSIIAFWCCFSIIRNIKKPLDEIDEAAKQMAAGSLNASIVYNADDEFGSLANSMRVMMIGIRNIIKDIEHCLGSMANGDFTVETTCENNYIGDYAPILQYMNDINTKLSSVLKSISETTEQVNTGAHNLAEGASSLAEGAADQAGSVEELTATINEFAQQTEHNTKKTDDASNTAVLLSDVTNQSREQMELMQQAMEKISQTSNKIENIINTIESIATQTNLLSLNASIEAARAGEAGRGFAVVAGEIGELASQSAQAVVNTRSLIQSSLDEVKNGNEISEATARSMAEAINGIDQITAVIGEVKEASDQQLASMKQISSGIEQISSVIQNNSAAAEESSATSEELTAQAESLDNLVSQFKLK